jgi:hypothetical protein
MKLFAALLLSICNLCIAVAQFGPQNFAFQSEVNYPAKPVLGDLDNDGDLDLIFRQGNALYAFHNDGQGNFGTRQTLLNVNINNGSALGIVDVDGDGVNDLVAGPNWYPGLGGGVFGSAVYTGFSHSWGVLDDYDGDGDVDLLIMVGGATYIQFNDGSGTFTLGPLIGSGFTSQSFYPVHEDLDGDGVKDLAIGGENGSSGGWYQGLGGGAFGPKQTITEMNPQNFLIGADVDGDGDMDLVVSSTGATSRRWLANDGSGNFTLGATMNNGTNDHIGSIVADIDGDGDLDFSSNTRTDCNVRWWLNNGDGSAWTSMVLEDFNGYNLVGTSQALGDVDGDGVPDIIFMHGLGVAGWFKGLGNGNFGPRNTVGQCMGGASGMEAVDVDLDGDLDLVVTSTYGRQLTWYPNNGDGTFGDQQLIVDHLSGGGAVVTADVTGNGYPDVFTSRQEATYVRNNNGGGSWTVLSLPGSGIARAAMDVDGDGDIDLIGTGEWFQNDGNGNFTSITSTTLDAAGSIRIGDLNGDGIEDVMIGSGTTLVAAINDGAGNFTAIVSEGIAWRIDLADFDGDGDLDVLAMPNGVEVHVNLNDGNGNFTPQLLYSGLAGISRAIIAQDINGDGYMDVVFARSEGYTHMTYYCLNLGNGTLGPATIADPSAESTASLFMADMNGDLVPDLVNARFHSLAWQENFFFNAFRLRGSVFIDYGMDGVLDPIDQKVPFRLVRSDATEILQWTNSAGDYDLPAGIGTWEVWHTPPSDFVSTNDPDTLVATLSDTGPIATGLDFGMVPVTSNSDGVVSVTTSGPYRCDADVVKWIVVQNTGGSVSQGVMIEYYLHPSVTVNAIMPQPDSVANNRIYWSLDSLGWFQQFTAQLEFTMGPLLSEAAFGYNVTVAEPVQSFTQYLAPFQVICAYDPNDKLVTPVGYGVHGAVPVDIAWLDYTIRFQNTGNDTAFTVVVRDTLHGALDRTSMEVLAASHPLTGITVDENNMATFRFDQIFLPDSIVDEPASHGYVRFRIRPMPGTPHLTAITNTAGIHFDLNPPIITNTTLNTLVDCGLYSAQIDASGGNVATASTGDLYQWYLNGVPLGGATDAELELDVNGEYTVEVTSEYGCIAVSEPYVHISTSMHDRSGPMITLQPNPFTDQLQIGFGEALPTGSHIELLDAQGRLLRTYPAAGRSMLTFQREGLASGTYLLRVVGPDGTLGERRVVVTAP